MVSISKYITDEALLSQLKNAKEEFIKEVYTDMREDFIKFVISKFHVDESVARDIYPECFSIFFYNIKDGKLVAPLRSSLKTYLLSIGKNIFLKRYHGTYHKKVELSPIIPEVEEPHPELDYYEYDQQKYLVNKLLEKIGDKCNALLTMIYLKEIKSDEICKNLNINSLGTLRKRKFDCLKKMRKMLTSLPNYKRLWTE